ncbi:ATP-binding protein [Sedimentibacter sp.]|uniref:ATP-binding protein n=1 Tax=Sedimentibacter sp. TaxID=1960295 RepID=UPI00289695C9|nr:ATP-binding protein [Sedimentibacter sp.]
MKKEYYNNYNLNQYENEVESYKEGRFKGTVFAKYITQKELTYKNNELIEALPPIKSRKETFNLLEMMPIYSDSEREKEAIDRLHAVFRLNEYLFPISKHFEIEQNISISIRRGYVNKKIFDPDHVRNLRKLSTIINSTPNDVSQYKNLVLLANNSAPSASGFSIFGVSGGGKSTAVNNILSFYPQHVIHTTDGEKQFLFHQLPWIKIDCPYNGNIKGLCQKFFSAVDDVLGTTYLKKYGANSNSIDRMIIAIAHIALMHGLGLLVIDEIQHLKTLKNKGSDAALNFFVTLMNEIKLPIVYIGTYKAIETLSDDFRQTRRTNGIGIVEMNYLERDEFNIFLKFLWKYQWVKNKCELTDELCDVMYDNTMGILDVIVKLFIAIQVEAIRSEKEIITKNLISRVAKQKFPFVKKIIDAIRNDDNEALREYEDVKSYSSWFSELHENTKVEIENREKAREIQQGEERKKKLKKQEIINDICIFLEEMGYEYSKVEDVVKSVVDRHDIKKNDISFLKKEVAKEILKLTSTTKAKGRDIIVKEFNDYDDFLEDNKKESID